MTDPGQAWGGGSVESPASSGRFDGPGIAWLFAAMQAAGFAHWRWIPSMNRFAPAPANVLPPGADRDAAITADEFLARVHPEDRGRLAQTRLAAVQQRGRYGVEYRLRFPDGTDHWVIERGGAAAPPSGEEAILHGVLLPDWNDQSAPRPKDFLAALVASSHDAIVSKTLDGVITSWNAAAERLFGYTAREAVGQSITMIIPSERQDEEQEILARIRAGEVVDHYETVRVAKDGRWLNISLTTSPIRNSHGRIVGASKIAREISDQKQAKKALRESEERFRTLADNIAQLAWMCDEFGDITWYNQRWFEYTGTTMEQMAGWGWRQVHHPDHIDRVMAEVRRCAETEQVWEDTFPLRGKDGTYRWFLSRAVPIRNEEGRVVRWFGTNTDITERLAMEEALKEAGRRKDEFLALLGHELRNPLTAIVNGVRLLSSLQGDPDKLETVRQLVERQSGHMTRLVEDLLDVARITRGKISLRRKRVDLAALVRTAADDHRAEIEQEGCSFDVELPEAPLWIDGDPTRIAQVVGNLLHNAAKFTDPGGRVVLRLAPHREQRLAVVSVRDTGIGIEPDVLGQLFEPFQQAETSLERGHGGLGMGLALVKALTELHGGAVSAHSDGPGRGSEFLLELPLAEDAGAEPDTRPETAAATSEDEDAAGAVGRRPLRILLVEDSAPVARVFALTLESMGDDVQTVASGAEALEAIAAAPTDVVISDISMPGMSGYQLAQRIRANDAWRGIYLIAGTGYGQPEDRRRALEAGFDEYLVKPLEIDQLEAIFARLASRGGD